VVAVVVVVVVAVAVGVGVAVGVVIHRNRNGVRKTPAGGPAGAKRAARAWMALAEPKGRCLTLVLSRKVGEKLLIGDNVTLTINRISGNRVTIGIDAPGNVHIVRGELERYEAPKEPVKQ
jgi:carbon storage regulator